MLPDGWKNKKLDEVCRLWNGRAYKKDELLGSGKYLVLRVGNFFTNDRWYYSDLELEDEKYCDDGDLLYAWSASFGPRIWTGGKVIYHYHIWKVAVDDRLIDRDFLFHFFDWDAAEIKSSMGSGSTMIHVTKSAMEQRKIGLPPLDEQRRIAEVLRSVDVVIAANEAVAAQARRAYQVALTELVGSSHDHQRAVRLGQIAELSLGKMLDKLKNRGELHPYLANINVRWGSFDLQDLREMRFEKREFERYALRAGDIVMCEGGEPGRCALWMDEVPGMMIQKALHRIRPMEGIDSRYLYYALSHKGISGAFDEYMTGGGIKHLPGVQLAKVEVSIPPLDEQRRIAEVLRSMDEATAVGQKNAEQARQIKSGLMSDLLSGRVRVPA